MDEDTCMATSDHTRERWLATRPWIDDPDCDIDAYCRDHRGTDFDLGAYLRQWKRDGLVVFRKAADPSLLDRYADELAWVLAHPDALPISYDDAGTMTPLAQLTAEQVRERRGLKLYSVHDYSDAAKELLLTKPVVQFLSHVFRERPAPMSSLSFATGSQQMVHADYAYVQLQKTLPHMAASWIALEDVAPGSGPLAYYPGSHDVDRFGLFDFGLGRVVLEPGSPRQPIDFTHWLRRRIEELGLERVVALPQKGDILVWHAALAHEGTPITDAAATRRSLVCHYTSAPNIPEECITRRRWTGRPVCFQRHGGVIYKAPWVAAGARIPTPGWRRGG